MERIRQFIREKPWAGWIVALMILAAAGVIIYQQNRPKGIYDAGSMTEMVTIKYIDTGEEEEIPRGRVDKMLRDQQTGKVDPAKGLINPKTGQPTGFPIDKRNWEAWINRINEDRAQYGTSESVAPRNRPTPTGPIPTPPPAPKPGN